MRTIRLHIIGSFTLLLIGGLMTERVDAHCQIPCGIYDDQTRGTLIGEHITTIEKSMKKIIELSGEKSVNNNQLIRWVLNKEQHADKISKIVTYYFMTQRIKPAKKSDKKAWEAYVEKLTLLHQILVSAMKAKQTTDLEHVEKLRSSLDHFIHAYGGIPHKH